VVKVGLRALTTTQPPPKERCLTQAEVADAGFTCPSCPFSSRAKNLIDHRVEVGEALQVRHRVRVNQPGELLGRCLRNSRLALSLGTVHVKEG